MARKKAPSGNIVQRGFSTALNFLGEVKAELTKVAWPSKAEVIASTWVVLFAVGITAVWIFAADQLSSLLINGLIRLIH
ncbi:MAG: preprotein translocase subunit SecE [Candidatus Aegiribacteria sp.]|nr:preprotein translocase subunit SecE [Candidatus Aegiribacteria sp.]MBD3293985.1 preprotein translocase subunit SecE [Candidatus Fermentibacteria bacterium]